MNQITWTNEKRTLRQLSPWEHNPRYIKDAQAERLLDSFNEFGQVLPICIGPDNEIYDGHQRKSVIGAADEYGLDYEIDVRVASRALTERERQKLTIYLHKGAAGDWDWEELANSFDFSDLVLWGFDEEQLLGMDFAPEESEPSDAEPQIDKAAELQEKWQTATGQLWRIGEHRLIVGDCTDADVVARVMGGEKADIGITSPPYNNSVGGMKYDYYGESKRFYQDESMDKKAPEEWVSFCGDVINRFCEHVSGDNAPLLWNVMYNANMRHHYGLSMFAGGHAMTVKETICWNKKNGFNISSKGILSRNWELIFLLSLGNEYFTTQGKNEVRYSKWEVETSGSQIEDVHHASFPIGIPTKALDWFSLPGHICYEPFAGSGTTLVACENLSRKCRAIEISPNYCAVILQRMQDAFPGIEIEQL